jgi:anti-sigma factor RsiW
MTATPTPIRECDQALDYLYSMLEGEAKARFEQHLATCARCKEELSAFGSVRKVAQEALASVEPAERLTGPLHQQLMHAAAQRKPRGKVIPFLRRVVSHPGYAAAAAFLLVGGAVGVQWSRGQLKMAPVASESTAVAPAPAPS